MDTNRNGESPFTILTLMIAIAVCAVLLLAPVVWFSRQRALVQAARAEAELARAQAMRGQYAAQTQAAQAAPANAGASSANGLVDRSAVPRGGFWAALSVNHSLFRKGDVKDLAIEFTLFNDGESVLDPRIADSRILVNGEEMADSGLILANGPRDARFSALPAKDELRFVYALGDRFKEPGVYRVSWKGKSFHSPDVVFRVLADKAP
jgi:hypothetical protein